jgi:myo-inositol-1(or 4)-monophosphatase
LTWQRPLPCRGVEDVELAVAAAEAGAAVVRSRFGTPLTRIGKGGIDFATDVDVEAERAIVELLLAYRPADGVLAEEAGPLGDADADRCWLVDPLCGTLNFAAGTGPVAVNVALRDGDTVTAAAIADPLAAVVDWTDGTVAHRRRDGQDHRLEPSATSRLVDLNVDANGSSAHLTTVALLSDAELTSAFGPRVVSTSLALAWVASGQRAAYVTDGHLEGSVHFTAGIALCIAAGCVVTNLEGGPIHTGPGGLIAAADAPTHRLLCTMTTRLLPRHA